MKKQYEKRITWTIKKFSSLQSEIIYSDPFVVGGCKWRLRAYPKGVNTSDYSLSLFLEVANSESLPSGWKRRVKYSLIIVNQFSDKLSERRESQNSLFDQKGSTWGYIKMISLTKLLDRIGGFMIKDDVKIAVEVGIHEAIGKTDVLEETSLVMETMDVKGFQVFSAQVEYVKSLFKKHPDIATNVHTKNQYLKKGYMNVLLGVTDILRRSPKEISKENLAEANAAVKSLTDVGFKLDWLVKKLNQVQEKKVKEEAGETRMQKIEEELKDLKRKRSDLKAQLEKESAEVMAARAPLLLSDESDDDVEEEFKSLSSFPLSESDDDVDICV